MDPAYTDWTALFPKPAVWRHAMHMPSQRSQLPRHVGLIPDGNRRWARQRGLEPQLGYLEGVKCGLKMLDDCIGLGIEEVSVYGFTTDNTKRPRVQREAFSLACEMFAARAMERDVSLKVVGDATSPCFPKALSAFATSRQGDGHLKVNMLVNYGWAWDLQTALCRSQELGECRPIQDLMGSSDVSRIDLMVRWGGMRRLSGFLPVQCVYADFFVVDDLWPDYKLQQFEGALDWFAKQDRTLGG